MPRPTLPALALLQRQLAVRPTHGLSTARYPVALLKRPGAPPPAGPGGAAGPARGDPPLTLAGQGHVWPFWVVAGAGDVRSTGVSPVYQGPLLVERIIFGMTTANVSTGGVSLLYAIGQGTRQQNVAGNILPGGSQLWDAHTTVRPVGDSFDEHAGHFGIGAYFEGTAYPMDAVLNLRVPEVGPVVLMISVRATAAVTITMQGLVTLRERVPW